LVKKIKIPSVVMALEKAINQKLKGKLAPNEFVVLVSVVKGGVHFWVYPSIADLELADKIMSTCTMQIRQMKEYQKAQIEEYKANKLRAVYVV